MHSTLECGRQTLLYHLLQELQNSNVQVGGAREGATQNVMSICVIVLLLLLLLLLLLALPVSQLSHRAFTTKRPSKGP